jgi:hypothetical protein
MPSTKVAVGRPAEVADLLRELLRRTQEIEAAPRPPDWRSWDMRRWAEDREYGPLYAPRDWFGGGEPLPEAERVRYLRAVRRLAGEGLLTMIVSERGGKLQRLRLTRAGRAAAEAATS